MTRPHFSRSQLPLFCVLLALFAAFLSGEWSRRAETLSAQNTTASFEKFEAWLDKRSTTDTESLNKGIALAKLRRVEMLALIQNDPREALARSLSFSEFAALPEEIQAQVERPFSAPAEILALPVCTPFPGQRETMSYELAIGSEHYSASVFGRRQNIGSKESSPLQGITLGRYAAVREEILQEVRSQDALLFPQGQADPQRCLATGNRLKSGAITAIAGGRQFHFSDAETLAVFDQRLAGFDRKPGPHTGAQVIFLYADGDQGFDWEAAEDEVDLQASTWTETPKDVYFIRVDFSDVPGASISQTELAGYMNSTVSDAISEYSYGKTEIDGTVSHIVVRMPHPTSSYTSTNNNALHSDAKLAAAVQIPGLDLSIYDIVGVHFATIGMGSNPSSSYSGLAGGSRVWIQGNSSSNVMIHEFGHNYGVGHASFWDTSDGSVIGAGTSVEYGNDFDIMGDGSNAAHFGPQAKQKLNWLKPTQWTDADSGTYRVYRFDHPGTTAVIRSLRILKAASPAEYYWLGYRKNLPDNPWLQSGAYLTWERPNEDRTWLLDTTPGSASGSDDGAISPGRTYSDTTAGVHVTTLGTGGSAPNDWIDVTVNLGSFSGNYSPTASISGPTTANARESVTFSVNASDSNGDALAYFWDIGDGSISANASSQAITWAVGGTYTISVTVTDMKGGTVTKAHAVTVSDPLDNWTQHTTGTTDDIHDIATDGTRLVTVGSRADSVLTSTDGTTWTSGSAGLNVYLRGVAWDGGQFIAAGYDYQFAEPAGFKGALFTSADGSSWTLQQRSGPRLLDIATNGNVHVAVGEEGSIWRSTNGIDWTPSPSGTTIDLKGVSYGDGTFVAVGSGGPGNSGGPVVVVTSTDGSSWTDTSSGAGTLSGQGFYDVEYCNDRFLACGFYSKLRYSTDGGANFLTTRSGSEQIPAFAHGNGVYLAAGIDRDNADANLNLISTDGEDWSELSANPAHADRNAAIFFGNSFYTAGDNGEIWQSDELAPTISGLFAIWLDQYFPGTTPATHALLDADNDGASNLQEYASGTNPTEASSVALPAGSIESGFFTLTLNKNSTATDVTFSVEASPDMTDWSSTGTVIVNETANTLVVRSNTSGRTFLRAVYTFAE